MSNLDFYEIDCLVAEKVMGFSKSEWKNQIGYETSDKTVFYSHPFYF